MAKMKMAASNPVTEEYVRGYLRKLAKVLSALDPREVAKAGKLLFEARAAGRHVFVMGNGGSAASASHFAVDLGKGASRGRKKRFRVLSLADNVPWLTALGNDLAYEDVFVEQLANFAARGDVVIAISAGGNSPNVLKAVEYANAAGCATVGLSGYKGGKLKGLVRRHVHVPASHMGLIEDGQMAVCHILVYAFMDEEGCG